MTHPPATSVFRTVFERVQSFQIQVDSFVHAWDVISCIGKKWRDICPTSVGNFSDAYLRKKATKARRGHWRCSVNKGFLKNFANFTGKHLC